MEVDLRRLLGEAPARADRHRRTPVAVAPKVAVIGNTGSGKTTFARRLAESLGVPHVELDALFWRPNWEMAPTDEFRAQVDEVLAGDGWVIDGNYTGRLGHAVLERADVVVWLDMPLRTILPRLLRRTLRRIASNEPLWGTNRETFRGAFLSRDSLFLWALKSRRKWRTAHERLTQYNVVRLRSPREANVWLRRYVNVRM